MRERLESSISWRWASPQTPEAIDEDERPTGRYPVAPVFDEDERPTRPDHQTVEAIADSIAVDEAFDRISVVG